MTWLHAAIKIRFQRDVFTSKSKQYKDASIWGDEGLNESIFIDDKKDEIWLAEYNGVYNIKKYLW